MARITTATAARILGVSRRQIIYLIHKGHLPARRVGRDWLLNATDVVAFERRPSGRPKQQEKE